MNGQISFLFYEAGTNGTGSYWVHNKGMNITFADGHAKYQKMGATNTKNSIFDNDVINPNEGITDCHVDPGFGYDRYGYPYWVWLAVGLNG